MKRGRKPFDWTPEMDTWFATMNDPMIAEKLGISVTSVRMRRIALGLKPSKCRRPQEPRVRWTPEMDALLGTMFDYQLSEKLGISKTYVFKRRTELGIPACTILADRWQHPDFVAQLGKRTDASIAKETGVSRERIRLIRTARGIPSFVSTGPDWASVADRLGAEPDYKLARELGVRTHAVTAYRRNQNIALVLEKLEQKLDRREGVPANWRELLGKIPDNQLRRQWGISLSSVNRLRAKMGIPPFQPRQTARVDWKDPAVIAQLGKETDVALAEKFGLSKVTVTAKRLALGIPPLHPKRRRAKSTNTEGEET